MNPINHTLGILHSYGMYGAPGSFGGHNHGGGGDSTAFLLFVAVVIVGVIAVVAYNHLSTLRRERELLADAERIRNQPFNPNERPRMRSMTSKWGNILE